MRVTDEQDDATWQQRCLLRLSGELSPEDAAVVDRELAADPERARYAREAATTERMGRVCLPDDGPSDTVLAALQQAADEVIRSRRVIHFPSVTLRRLAVAALALVMVGMSLHYLPSRSPGNGPVAAPDDSSWLLAALSDDFGAVLEAGDESFEPVDEDAMTQQLLEWQGFTMDSSGEDEWLTPLLPLPQTLEPTALRERRIRAFPAATRG
jgi:anti-sigma factor RsiW